MSQHFLWVLLTEEELVDVLWHSLHDIVEKHDNHTQATRLDRADLTEWLEQYRLGQLWTRGQIGGVRW